MSRDRKYVTLIVKQSTKQAPNKRRGGQRPRNSWELFGDRDDQRQLHPVNLAGRVGYCRDRGHAVTRRGGQSRSR